MSRAGTLLCLMACAAAAGCAREQRSFPKPEDNHANVAAQTASRLTPLQPATGKSEPVAVASSNRSRYDVNAYAVSQGKRLFRWYNCNGCHAQGGGGIGPALTDNSWFYGIAPEQIFETIERGRPNGMPSFGGHIPEDQIWQLVAYVRSMSGQLRTDVAPSRADSLQDSKPEARRDREQPRLDGPPPKPS